MMLLGRSKVPIHPKHLFDKGKNNLLNNLLKSKKGGSFLDIGSGAGSELLDAAKLGWQVYGIEKDLKNIEISKFRIKNMINKRIKIFQHDLEITPLPIKSNQINLINFTNVLEHINNREEILKDIQRILIEDGECIISIPNKQTTWKKIQRFAGIDSRDDIDHKIEYSLEEIKHEIKKANLSIKSNFYPIIPSSPFDGILSISSIFSPYLYKKTQKLKRDLIKNNLNDSIGWVFIVKK